MSLDDVMKSAFDNKISSLMNDVQSLTSSLNSFARVDNEHENSDDSSEGSDSEEEFGDNQHTVSKTHFDCNGSKPTTATFKDRASESKLANMSLDSVDVSRNYVEHNTIPVISQSSEIINASVVEEIENDLDFYERVSLVFLLYDSDDLALQRVMTAYKSFDSGSITHCRLLADWALHESSGNWTDKFLEALCIIGNFSWVRKLGYRTEDVIERFLPHNYDTSLFVDLMRKAIYHTCECLTVQQLERLTNLVAQDMENEGRLAARYDARYMEMNILHWMCQRYLNVGVSGSCDINIKNLTKHLKVIEEYEMVDYLESISRYCGRSDAFSDPSLCDQLSVRSATSHAHSFSHSVVSQCQEGSPRNTMSPQDVYPIDSNNIGFCVIINQKSFYKEQNPKLQHLVHDHLEPRTGTDVDRDRLTEIFLNYGFSVRIWDNLTHLEMIHAIKDAVTSSFKKEHSCFALCILSHGRKRELTFLRRRAIVIVLTSGFLISYQWLKQEKSRGGLLAPEFSKDFLNISPMLQTEFAKNAVYGINSISVEMDDIEKLLNGKYCPNLIDKPKIILIQACQGLVKQNALVPDIGMDGVVYTKTTPEVCDTLTFWSTVPGYAAFRDRIAGSWFIKSIWEELLRKENGGLDTLSLFVNVTAKVCNKRAPIDGELKAMTPQFSTTFRRKLIFPYLPEAHKKVAKRMLERYLFTYLLKEYIKKEYEKEKERNKYKSISSVS